MFGNRLGWSISSVIVLVAVWLLTAIGRQGDVSPPTAFGREAAGYTVELPVEPMVLAPFMTEAYDSAPVYQEALEAYKADRRAYDDLANVGQASSVRAGMELLIKAGKSKSGGVFSPNPAQVINYDVEHTNLEDVKSLGKTAAKLGVLYLRDGKPEEARKYFEAVFALGAKLYRERLTFWELDVASELLTDGAYNLAKVHAAAGEHDRADQYENFDRQKADFVKSRIIPVRNTVLALDPHAGDMIALAENAGDVMWRTDAILALGRVKFSAARFGDQQGAVRKLEELSADADPRIRRAAQVAKELKVEEFRKLR